MPTAPLPAGASKPSTRTSSIRRSAAAATIACAKRMLARPFDAGGEAQHLVLDEAVRRNDGDDLRPAFGQRAGLVDHQRVDLLHAFERLGVADQHAGLRAAADADHDRHRRRKSERARAGDDQHADRGDDAVGNARLRSERRPGDEGDHRHRDHGRHEPARRPGRRAAGSARASAAPRSPSARSARSACRGRPCRRASRTSRTG